MVDPKPVFPILNTADPLTTGLLVAHPVLDGIGTTLTDLSGNSNDSTATGGFTWFNDPELGVVLELDGTSGHVLLDTGLNAILDVQTGASVAFWLKLRNATPVDPNKTGLITIQDLTGAGAATLYPDTDGLGYFSTFRELSRVNGVNLGATDRETWHHLAITAFSAGTYRIYINGVEVGNAANEFGIHATIAATIGKSTDAGGDYYLDGYIGDFRLWNRVLAAPEVLTQFNDPWRLYLTPIALPLNFPTIAPMVDARIEPDAAVGAVQLVADLQNKASTNVDAFAVHGDVDLYPDSGGVSLAVQVDVVPTDPLSFPPVGDDRDPTRKPDTPTKFASAFDTDLTVAIPFAEGSGITAADYAGSAGGPHNATLVGAATWAAGGFPANDFSQALGLDPNGSYAEITRNAEHEPATNITVAGWCLPDSTQAGRGVFAKLGTATTSWYIGTGSTTNWRFRLTDDVDGARNLDGGTLTPGERAHIVGTYDGAVMRLYVNGVEVNNVGNSGNIVYDVGNNLRVGQEEGGTSFSGVIDDVRLWNNRTLDADEVMTLYQSEFAIYCDQGLARSIIPMVDARIEPDAAVNSAQLVADLRHTPTTAVTEMQLQADLEIYPPAGATYLAAQVDVAPPVSNPSGLAVLLIEPTSGSVNGGTPVTIRGLNFEDITDVQIGGVSITSLVNPDISTITGVTGPRVPGFADVTVFSASRGNATLINGYSYVPFFGNGSDLLLKGVQIDPSLVRTEYFTGESAPIATNTTLSFVLDDYPIDVTAVELYIRRVGENGGTLQRQGSIYQYTVDFANRQIIWRDTASFALIPTDEIIVRYLAQGAT